MKCEICGHKIPVNQNECPNCGNKIEKEHQISYHVNSSSHEHVKVNQTKKSASKVKSIVSLMIVFLVMCLIVGVGFIFAMIFGSSGDSFEDYLENTGDKNNTITLAIQYRDQVEEYLENKNLHNISYDEYVEDEDTLKAKCEFECSDNVADYNLSFTFSNGIQTELTLKVEMEEVDENIYTSLRNLSVFDELLGRDSAKDIKQIREEHIDDREVHFSNYTTIVDETTDYNLTDFEWYYDSQYTIAGNGYRINE